MSNNKFKVLIVEDEANICSFIETLLTTNDYQALVAHTCTMGLTLFASHNPDLVILDLGLPDRDGLELIRTVRQKYMTPIIVLSARTDEMDKIEALDLGANDYITKPFGTGELLARVRVALRLNRYSRTGDAACGGEFQAQELRPPQGVRGRAGGAPDPDGIQHRGLFVPACRPGDDLRRHRAGHLGRYRCGQHQKAAGEHGQYPQKAGQPSGQQCLYPQ